VTVEPDLASPEPDLGPVGPVGPLDVPVAEVDIDGDLVRRLLRAQHPDLAERPLEPLASGWDNAMFRLGADLTVRLPRRQLAATLVEHEQRVLPSSARCFPCRPGPRPRRSAGARYPWAWSVLPGSPGVPAIDEPPAGTPAAARLEAFVAALHRPAPADAPVNPYRGIALGERRPQLVEDLARLAGTEDRDRVLAVWDELAATPPWHGPPQWVHGDLHAANVLVHEGAVSAVIDFGDVTAGDPACDLAIGWMLFDPDARSAFRTASGADRRRGPGRGWAVCFGWCTSPARRARRRSCAWVGAPSTPRAGRELILAVPGSAHPGRAVGTPSSTSRGRRRIGSPGRRVRRRAKMWACPPGGPP
jgi:aminoglycoside phosphotransferase (APT) family kinase protein